MARLPTPGSDDGTWGDVLNDFLSVEHNSDGSQKTLSQTKITNLTTDLAEKVVKGDLVFNVKDYDAVGDGVIDDTAAIQSAIDAVTAFGVGIPVASLFFPPGIYRLTSTIEINRTGGKFIGAGIGNPSNYTPNPGKGTTFKWDGAAGEPMFRIRDAQHLHMQDFLFVGNDTNPPSSALRFHSEGGTIGTNQYLSVQRCHFGRLPWLISGGYSMDRCVIFDGINANNDQFRFDDCVFSRPTIECFSLPNTQSVWGVLMNCTFEGNFLAKGLVSSASVDLINPSFDACTVDIQADAGNICVYGINSERSSRILNVGQNSVSWVGFYGGTIQLTGNVFESENYFVKQLNVNSGGGFAFIGVLFSQSGTPRPTLYARSSQNTTIAGQIRIEGCKGLTAADFNIAAAILQRPLWVHIETDDLNIHRRLIEAQSLDTSFVTNDALGGVSADNGDAGKTLNPLSHENVQVWSSPLTADRTVTLSNVGSQSGKRWKIVRASTATGAFNLNIGTTPLKTLSVGQWCEVAYSGSAWILIASGDL